MSKTKKESAVDPVPAPEAKDPVALAAATLESDPKFIARIQGQIEKKFTVGLLPLISLAIDASKASIAAGADLERALNRVRSHYKKFGL